MLKAILLVNDDLTSFETRYGPLILRKENKVEIEEVFSRSGVDIHLTYARVLNYAYQKEDWCEGNSYAVTYHFRYQGIKSRLYTFRVPVTAYDVDLRIRVEEKVALFNSLLKKFDFVFYSGSELFLDS